jgi:hypothetical protein
MVKGPSWDNTSIVLDASSYLDKGWKYNNFQNTNDQAFRQNSAGEFVLMFTSAVSATTLGNNAEMGTVQLDGEIEFTEPEGLSGGYVLRVSDEERLLIEKLRAEKESKESKEKRDSDKGDTDLIKEEILKMKEQIAQLHDEKWVDLKSTALKSSSIKGTSSSSR